MSIPPGGRVYVQQGQFLACAGDTEQIKSATTIKTKFYCRIQVNPTKQTHVHKRRASCFWSNHPKMSQRSNCLESNERAEKVSIISLFLGSKNHKTKRSTTYVLIRLIE